LIADSQTIEYAAANTFEFISAIIWSKTHIAIFEGVTAKIKKQKIKDNIER
jgi:hypothetical protein